MQLDSMSCSVPDKEKQKWEKEAEELNISFSEYVRKRVRAGRLLLKSGDIDTDLLDAAVQREEISEGFSSNTPKTLEDDLSDQVLRELPKEGTGKEVDESELRSLVFGSKKKQREKIEAVCKELDEQGKITRVFSGGLVRTDD